MPPNKAKFPDVPEAIRARMARIRKTDTKPELAVRRCVHRMGYRFRLHRRDLPGTPDLVFPSRRQIILVHGCFWHQHDCPHGRKKPRARQDYWLPKLTRNVLRDRTVIAELIRSGWSVLVIWECEVKDLSALSARLQRFLAPSLASERQPRQGRELRAGYR